jgi:hypothetical protein
MTNPVVSRRSTALLIGILMLVNSAAIWGQAGWALEHIVPAQWDWRAGLALALGFAAALELIGVFLATMADEAEARHQSAGGIRLGSYAVGLVSGALNLSHWGVWTAAAAAFGFLSAVSPFLWGIYSRVRRGRPIAPSRRFWHPVAAVRLIRHMAWRGLTDELAAIEALAEADAPLAPPVGLTSAAAAASARARRVRHRRSLRAVRVTQPHRCVTPAQEPRQDDRATHEVIHAVLAIKTAYPDLPQRRIAVLAATSEATVRRALRRTRAAEATQPTVEVNGKVPDLEGAK